MDFGFLVTAAPPGPSNDEPLIAVRANQSELGCWSLGYTPALTRTLTLSGDFSVNGNVAVNLRELIDNRRIDACRSIYMYNDSAFPVTITNEPSGQIVQIPAMSFGFVPILAHNQEEITITGDVSLGVARVILTNVVMPMEFGTIAGA